MQSQYCNLYTEQIAAGFPSPARDYIEEEMDLNTFLVKHPVATFFVRVAGDSMIGSGIYPGDILIVDRSLEPRNAQIVVAIVNGEFTVKQLQIKSSGPILWPTNKKYHPIIITDAMEFAVWGVVIHAIHTFKH